MAQVIQRLALAQIDPDPQPFKKAMAARFLDGLRASLDEFEFTGTMIVAPTPDGRFVCCDGNTRLAELQMRGVEAIECVIRPDLTDPARRRLFQMTFDRHKKPYDEAELTREMARLQDVYPVESLARLTARLDVLSRQTLTSAPDEGHGTDGSPRATDARTLAVPRPAPRAATFDYAILSLAGPSDLIDEIKLMLPKRLDHLRSLRRIREALDEPTPLEDDDYVTLLIHDALRLRQWRGGAP